MAALPSRLRAGAPARCGEANVMIHLNEIDYEKVAKAAQEWKPIHSHKALTFVDIASILRLSIGVENVPFDNMPNLHKSEIRAWFDDFAMPIFRVLIDLGYVEESSKRMYVCQDK
jgi:hypothetical protein